MAISIYDISVPVFLQALKGLDMVLEKAEAFADARGLEHAAILRASLYPDMFDFARQVQIATNHPLRVCQLLGAAATPDLGADEADLPALRARIAKTAEFLRALPREQIEGTEDKMVIHRFVSGREVEYTGLGYLIYWALPNFYFHVSTAYGVLRELGVAINKRDYMGGDTPK